MAIVQRLHLLLPADFTAEPRANMGANYEVDVGTFEDDEPKRPAFIFNEGSGGTATATIVAPEPSLVVDTELADQYEYEVLVYDHSRTRQLVAAVEIVSPANKDRPDSRRAFVTKCAALIQQGVCVSIVDMVTTRHANLYIETLDLLGQVDPAFAARTAGIYAVTYRRRRIEGSRKTHTRYESWAYPLVIGQPLPILPLWLTDDMWVPLELEPSYEETCRVLRIG